MTDITEVTGRTMTGKRRRPAGTGLRLAALLVPLLAWSPARGVGLDGAGAADRRVTVSAGAGWDQVGGYGRDGYPVLELGGEVEGRLWGWLAVGAAATGRRDLSSYNFALARWRRGSWAFATQIFVGYDGPRFHLSVGPWVYGDNRDERPFRAAFLPYGVLRLRIGSQDGWHFTLRLLDGAPFTSAAGSTGLRLLLGAPARGVHRLAGGLYTSIGEKTVGLQALDEIGGAGPRGSALRLGGQLGTDLDHPGRPELLLFGGLAF